jgi:hypothetical protein
MIKHLIGALLLLLPLTLQASSTLRCDNGLISTGDSTRQVSQKCGEPLSRDVLGYREVLDEYGFYHEVVIEEWSYSPRNGMYQFLRFEGNRLIKIDSKRKQ